MSIGTALGIATGGLANINRQLALVSHNISNAATEGYVRERGTQTALTADGIGLGVRSGPALRDVDRMLRAQVTTQQARAEDAATRNTALAALDALHGVPGDGTDLPGLLGKLTDAFSTLAGDPSNQAGQMQALRAADTLAIGINTLATATLTQRQAAQDGLVADVVALNDGLARIGALTGRIMALKAGGQSTADLESERDQAVAGIAGLAEIKMLEQEDGELLLVASGGLALPVHGTGPSFSVSAANAGATAFYPAGGLPGIMLNGVDGTAQLRGGRIGAHVSLRDSVLPGFLAELDEFSQSLAGRFEAQGLRLFTNPAGAAPPGGSFPPQSGYVGFAAVIQVNPAMSTAPALLRDGTHAVAGSPTGPAAFTPNPPGGPAGFTSLIHRVLDFALGTEAQQGVPQPAPATSSLGPSGTLAARFATPATLAGFARDLVAAQTTQAATAAGQAETESAVQAALASRYADTTGVDTDAEMALMLQLQNAYSANARVIAASQAMWDQLLNAVT